MPFGKKTDDSGRMIDFDLIYEQIIVPACESAALEPIRADEEVLGGLIHKPMFERLMLCDFAIADLSTANANVFYELGVRHGIRPHSTVLIFGRGMRLPFDVAPLRGIPYELDAHGRPSATSADVNSIAERLVACRDPIDDSPLFQLVSEWPRPELGRLKTDAFRELVRYSEAIKKELASAREVGEADIQRVERSLNLMDVDPAIIVDLYLSYRAVKAWGEMIRLHGEMPALLQRTVLVREQLALALNRSNRPEAAEKVLKQIIDERGASSETNGILGRVYKDRWQAALSAGSNLEAEAWLRRAIDAYLAGVESDWRDAYPGINAATLMTIRDPADPRIAEILPVVKYAVKRRCGFDEADYWDYATMLELRVLGMEKESVDVALGETLARVREKWEPETTARNLSLIRESFQKRGIAVDWLDNVIAELLKRVR